jgi:ComF family protein
VLVRTLLELFFPPRCVHCEINGSWFCQNCLDQISYTPTNVCRCGAVLPVEPPCKYCQSGFLQNLDGFRSATYFEEDSPIQSAIHALKYHNNRTVVKDFGKMLVDAYQRYQLNVDVVVPVPLHSSRFRERGYNQSELLAKELCQAYNLPLDTMTLHRIRQTEAQVRLKTNERYHNVYGAFSCSSNKLANQTVLLIDDVCTTGSTLDACAIALKQSDTISVWALTLAKELYLTSCCGSHPLTESHRMTS